MLSSHVQQYMLTVDYHTCSFFLQSMCNLCSLNGNELELMVINNLTCTLLVRVSALELVFIKVACDGFFFHTNLHILIANVYIVLMIMCRFQRKWMHYINLIKPCHIIFDTTLLANVYLSIYISTSIRLAVSLFSNAVWFLHMPQ